MTNHRAGSNWNKVGLLRILRPVFVIIFLVLVGLAVLKLTLTTNPSHLDRVKIQTEATLPDFELTEMKGSKVSISKFKSKLILINFWASWCEACMEEMPSLVELQRSYKKSELQIIGINLDENPENVVPKSIKEYGIEFHIFKD